MLSRIIPPVVLAVLSLINSTVALANFTTSFEGSEGYTNGSLDQSIQNGAPDFNLSGTTAGLYLPSGQKPTFGNVKRNPTAGNTRAFYVNGTGANFSAGNSWSVSLDFTFEGLQAGPTGTQHYLGELGLSTSASAKQNALSVAMMKDTNQDSAYVMYVNTQNAGGGYNNTNVSFASIGDDTVDDDDLTDQLRLTVLLTKSVVANEFQITANLFNLDVDPNTAIKTLTQTLTDANAYNADLYGFFSSGAVMEADNYDLFNAQAFSYSTVAEPSTYGLWLGFALLSIIAYKHRS